MSDVNSGLPIRSQLPGQVNYDDIITKIADGTTSSQLLAIDAAGLIGSKTYDKSGVGIDSQALSATRWLQVVTPDLGPSAPGTASAYASLAAGIYHVTPPTLTDTQQSALQLDVNGRLLVDAAITSTDDHNYGVVGANTLRSAAQIGNATGAADFNWGVIGAQSLRVAAEIGNQTGLANFNAGLTTSQTLRVVLPTDQTAIPVTQSGTWTTGRTWTLGSGTDSVTTIQGTSPWVVSGTVAVTQSTSPWVTSVNNLPTTVDTNFGVVGSSTLRSAAQIGNATGAADFNNGVTGAQTLRVAANLAVGGANVSGTNPIPVSFSSAPIGTPVNNYNTVAAVAAAASSNHDYTITSSKTFQGKKVWASASGLMKIEVQVSPDGSVFSTLWVGFNSTAEPNISIDMDEMVFLESGVGSKIRVIRTNLDKKAMDVYSTISGTEV